MTDIGLVAPPLVARTEEIADPGSLIELLPARDGLAWLHQGDGMIGIGEAIRYRCSSIAQAQQWWAEQAAVAEVTSTLDGAGTGLIAFGSFVFDDSHSSAESVLVVPQTVIGRRGGRFWSTRIGVGGSAPAGPPRSSRPMPPLNISYADGALSGHAWAGVVSEAVARINTGELDKVVLARDLLAFADNDIDARWLVHRLADDYEQCWTYLVDGLVGATPEMLIRRENGLATSRVLAGTIRRTGDDAHDLALAAALSRSSKDREEHRYAVRSVAQGLAPLCSGMNVPDIPYVLELPNVLHLASDVTAVAGPGADALALAAALHPSAAVCGTPTALARATIAELEGMDRGRYAGPVGWVDAAGDGEWAIALRCGQLSPTDPREIRLFAGCGIVSGSKPESELAEAAAKFVPMRDALGI